MVHEKMIWLSVVAVCFLIATIMLSATSTPISGLPADIIHVKFNDAVVTDATVGTIDTSQPISELRFGIWSYCLIHAGNVWDQPTGGGGMEGYNVTLYDSSQSRTIAIVTPSSTRGLVVYLFALVFSFTALVSSASAIVGSSTVEMHSVKGALYSALLAALVAVAALSISIALFVKVHYQMGTISGVSTTTTPGIGFLMTPVATTLLSIGAFLLWHRIIRKGMQSSAKTSA